MSRSRSPTCTPAHVLEPVVTDNGSSTMHLVPHHVTVPAGAPTEGLPVPLPRPAPGTAKWWVVGIVGCLSASPSPSGGAWPARSARSRGPTWATRTSTDRSISGDVRRAPPDRPRRVLRRAGPGQPRTAPVGAVTVTIPAGGRGVGAPRHAACSTTTKAVTGVVQTCSVLPEPAERCSRRRRGRHSCRAQDGPIPGPLGRLVLSHRGSGPRDLHRSGSGPASVAPAAAPDGRRRQPLDQLGV